MPIDRSTLLQHLVAQFDLLAAFTQQGTDDSISGYGPAIDYALTQTGTAYVDLVTGTVPAGHEHEALWLAEYAALERFRIRVALMVDLRVDAPLVDKKYSQITKNISDLLASTKQKLIDAGVLVGEFAIGRLNLDFLEGDELGWSEG